MKKFLYLGLQNKNKHLFENPMYLIRFEVLVFAFLKSFEKL